MPFVEQAPRAYTRQNVEALNENQLGVYGLYRQSAWIYVGKGDIRRRLLDHLNGDNSCISGQRPTHWVGEVIAGDPSSRERELIIELNPLCNQRVG